MAIDSVPSDHERPSKTPRVDDTDPLIRALLAPLNWLASLRLTVALFALAMFIIMVGTLAQDSQGMWEVISAYFRAWVSRIEAPVFFPDAWFPGMTEGTMRALVALGCIAVGAAAAIPCFARRHKHVWWLIGGFVVVALAAATAIQTVWKGEFLFPGGAAIGAGLAANLIVVHAVRFKIQASGVRLTIGLVVITLGALVTALIIAAGHNREGLQAVPFLAWSTLWLLCKITLTLFWLVMVAAFVVLLPTARTRTIEVTVLGTATFLLAGLLLWLWLGGESAYLGDSGMRILWQLIQSELAAVVLLVGCILAFKRRGGIVLIHAGVGLVMLYECYVSWYAVEERMTIAEGQTVSFAEDIRDTELTVVDPSYSDTHDDVIAIPRSRLVRSAAADTSIEHDDLPFDVQVVRYMKNSRFRRAERGDDNPASAGNGLAVIAEEAKVGSGADSSSTVDTASAYVRFIEKNGGDEIGTYLVTQYLSVQDISEKVTVGDKTYDVALRFKRTYKPYSIYLDEFRKDEYIGTSSAKNFSSEGLLIDSSGDETPIRIWMNNPLRYAGETFYQSSYRIDHETGEESTILQIVTNTGWMAPYVSCMLVVTGMLAHFWITLMRFLRRRAESGVRDGEVVMAQLAQAPATAPQKKRQRRKKQRGTEEAAAKPPGIRQNRGYLWLLFSFDGRIPRRIYWSAGFAVGQFLPMCALLLMVTFGRESRATLIGILALSVLWIWASLAVSVKRWHDRGKSAWWIFIGLIPIVGPFWALIEMGCLRGTRSSNQYGPESPCDGMVPFLVPTAVVLLAATWVLGKARSPGESPEGFDLAEFGKLPVVFQGRVKPFDTLARNALRKTSDYNSYKDDEGERQPAVRWLLDMIARPDEAEKHRVFRIYSREVRDTLGLKRRKGYHYSLAEIRGTGTLTARTDDHAGMVTVPAGRGPSNGTYDISWYDDEANYRSRRDMTGTVTEDEVKLSGGKGDPLPGVGISVVVNEQGKGLEEFDELVREARGVNDEKLKFHQRKALELNKRFATYQQLHVAFEPQGIPTIDHEALSRDRTTAQRDWVHRVIRSVSEAERRLEHMQVPLAVPQRTDGENDEQKAWLPYATACSKAYIQKEILGREADAPIVSLVSIFGAYKRGDASAFNTEVAEYRDWLGQQDLAELSTSRVAFEEFNNRFAPLFYCIFLYGFALVPAVGAYFGAKKLLSRTAFWLLLFILCVHTTAIVFRIYISGRPPSTNLYSSAFGIAWLCAVLGLILEAIFRLGFGNVVAAVGGFAGLLIAHFLGLRGDTFTVMEAVLDTQFWLTLHVITVFAGYAATFAAGLLGILYIILGFFTPILNRYASKSLASMTYGVLCFAIFFSFWGTVLGGLWADDSWGRFWGWDPKENGALLIVVWNVIILHVRWAGVAKDRGLAVLAVGGNIITSWSWFGVNQLGVGLHTYGHTDGVLLALSLFVASQLLIIAIGSLPKEMWKSFRDQDEPVLAEKV